MASEPLNDEVEQIFLGHSRDLRTEIEPLHDGADVGEKPLM